LLHPNPEKSREPGVNLLQTALTPRSVIGKDNSRTSAIRAVIAQLPKDGIRAGMTRLLTLTPSPEQFESWAGIRCEGGIEADIKDASIALLGRGDPLIAATKDVGVGRTFGFDSRDGGAGLAARIRGRLLAREEA